MPQSVHLLPEPPTHYCQARDNSGITEHTTKGQPSRQGKSRTHIIKWSKNKNNYIFLYCNYKRHSIDIIYSYSRALLTLQSLNALRRRHGVILSALSPPSGDRDSFSFHWNRNLKLRYPLTLLGVMFKFQSLETLKFFEQSLAYSMQISFIGRYCAESVWQTSIYTAELLLSKRINPSIPK